MLKKDRTFDWTADSTAAFEQVKDFLPSAPLLIVPDPDKDYEMSTDASNFAVEAVLSQDQGNSMRPVAFRGRKLYPAERNYPVHDKEMLGIMDGLKVFRCCVHGRFVRIFTDHHSLRFFTTQPMLNQRQIRWSETLQDYDYKIEYKAGAKNDVADVLSRRADHAELCVLNTIFVASVDDELLQGIQEGYRQNSLYSEENSERPPNVNLAEDGTWWYSEGKDDKRLCIPGSLRRGSRETHG